MRTKYNYNIFLENMDNYFNKSDSNSIKNKLSCETKEEIDKLVSLICENYENYQDFYYKATALYNVVGKSNKSNTDENNYVEVKENVDKTNEKEQQIIKEILDAIEEKSSMKKNQPKTNNNTSGVYYTTCYVSTLSSCHDKVLPNSNGLKENTKEKEKNNNKKKKGIPKSPIIVRKKVEINATINNIKDLIELTEKYPLNEEIEYNINMSSLHKI